MAALDRATGPLPAPAQCCSCGRPTDPLGFYDLGGSVDGYGALLICGSCVVELARRMRWSPPEAVSNAQQEMWKAKRALAAEQAHSNELELTLAGQVLGLIERVMDRHVSAEEDAGEPDGAVAAGGAAGRGPGGGGSAGRRRRGRAPGPDDGASAGPGPGDQRSGTVADAIAAAGENTG
jgi:hypothetical protein